MPAATYHIRKISVGLKRKYRISDDDGNGAAGETIGYAEKQLKVADELSVYRDEHRTEKLATIRESDAGWLAALTGFQVFDQDDRQLGSFGILLKRSVQRTTWQLEQPGFGKLVGTERSMRTARARRLLGLLDTAGQLAGALVKYHFDFDYAGELIFSIEEPKVFDDWYRLVVHQDVIDRRLLFALAVTMEARQRG